MQKRGRIIFKLSAIVVIIMVAAVLVIGYVNSLVSAHYALGSARDALKFNSRSIMNGIDELMMSRNNAAVANLIADISRDSEVYENIRLISHHTGEIVVSRSGEGGVLVPEDRACARCHVLDDPALGEMAITDEVIDRDGGGRYLSVTAPILNAEGCRNADCHVHKDAPPILGLLQVDYSLASVDGLIERSKAYTFAGVAVAILLSVAALWFTFKKVLEKPIHNLIAGTRRIANNDLGFKFDADRSDEIGQLEESFNNMTAQIRAHQTELRNTMEYLEGIVENSADIIITVSRDRLIQTFNKGAEDALGYTRDEVIGKDIETLFADPSEREVAIERLKHMDNVRNYEARFLTKSGDVRNVFLTLSRLRDRKGNPIGTFGISKDITEEKRLIRQLVQSKKYAAIGQAVTGIQHAIKNLLNALKGGAYLVRNGLAKDNRERLEDGWAMVEEGIERMSNLSLNMLNYAKDWAPDLETADIVDLADKACEVIRQRGSDKGVEVRMETTGEVPSAVCDPKLIHMAVMDIVSNALDACDWKDYADGETPEVVLSVSHAAIRREALIEVRDNGCGMTEEIKLSVFKPFFSTKKQWGTGLGLALTLRVIKVHGGRIEVESELDKGTVFRIFLPLEGPSSDKETVDGQESPDRRR